MLTKLTLTIDRAVIEKAKTFARGKNKSLSRIVEEYLQNITSGSKKVPFSKELKSPITDGLVGKFKDDGRDYKILIEEARLEKHIFAN